ncbi:MAG: hypothetical protein ACOY40_03685 [Bacillota bacterium]
MAVDTNDYVNWAEVVVLAPNKKADTLIENELEPIKKLLHVILPGWTEREDWLRNSFKSLPALINKDNWKIKLDYSAKTGLSLVASQNLPTTMKVNSPEASVSRPASSDKATSPRDFEKLYLPVVFRFPWGRPGKPGAGNGDGQEKGQAGSGWLLERTKRRRRFIKSGRHGLIAVSPSSKESFGRVALLHLLTPTAGGGCLFRSSKDPFIIFYASYLQNIPYVPASYYGDNNIITGNFARPVNS